MRLRAHVRTTPKANGSYLCDLNASNQNSIGADVGNESCARGQHLIHPQYHWLNSDNRTGFLPTSSSFTHGSSANEALLQFHGKMIFGNSGTAFDLDASLCVATPNDKALTNFPSSDQCNKEDTEYCDAPTGKELVLYRGEGSLEKLPNTEDCINDKSLTFAISGSTKVDCHPPEVTVTVPGCNSKKRPARSSVADRLRKARITENLTSLQELLPNSGKGDKEVALEDVISYVKYLRLQVKALSQSRLGGEATNDPFIHLEGFGHYLVDQQTLNEPLEELLGQMVEVDMSAVTKLLETKGLYVMPMSLAEALS